MILKTSTLALVSATLLLLSGCGDDKRSGQLSPELRDAGSASGSAAEFDKYHRSKGWDGLGYHFVIGNGTGSGDGQVEVGYRWKRQMVGAHAGNAEYNQRGIGICLVGDFQNGHNPTPR